ncbi:hypothetical protein L2737_08220 [Shewanella electrodiphila]|uniref:YMGG-like Gly-zipper domain-containing protein n=1 Tax=Shewanella electrodiphila TaxID=934143 RepID=A0ABT0KNN3_9GAMM|nr:hypothetical protein [Shewanella electrodiphila]MCL1045309.1 hypothetical protein [Shewanella electrodiphila]
MSKLNQTLLLKTAGLVSTFAVAAVMNFTVINSSYAEQYVFPQQNQSSELQASDEASCNSWAVSQTGYNPSQPQTIATTTQPTQVTPDSNDSADRGSGMRGAMAGAAAGAMIAEFGDDDRSDAAQNGAAIGAVAARRQSRRSNIQQAEQQQQAAQQQAAQRQAQVQTANAQGEENFYQARAACLEGKGYSVN